MDKHAHSPFGDIYVLFLLTITLSIIPRIHAEGPNWINYTNTDKVFAILDGGAYMWIGTDGGLVRIDKTTEEVKSYNRANAGLPDHHITALAIDSTGHVWVGTYYSGIGRLEGDSFITYNTQKSGLPHDQWNNALAVHPNGNILIGSMWYLAIFDGTAWKHHETGNPASSYNAINDIAIDKDGVAWIGASWGLGRYDGEQLLEGYADIHADIHAIVIDADHALWLGTNGKGLIRYDDAGSTVFDTTTSEIPGNIVYSMDRDADGNLWLGTENGLARYDGTHWTVYNTDNSGLKENVVFAVEVDEQDMIWIGLWHQGLMKYDGSVWEECSISNSVLPINSVYAIENAATKQEIWFGTATGIVRKQASGWVLYDSSSGAPVSSVFGLEFDAAGHLWVGAEFVPCLLEYDGTDWQVHDAAAGLPAYECVAELYLDEYGSLWFGTVYSGLFKYDGNDWINYNTNNSPLTCNSISSIVSDGQGTLWVGMEYLDEVRKGGLAKYNSENWTIYHTENSGIPYDNVGALVYDNNRDILWITTLVPGISGIEYGGGLTKYKGGAWTTYNIYNSELTSNTIFDLALDDNHNLWLGTGWGGLVKLDSESNWTVYNKMNSGIGSDLIAEVDVDWNGNKWMGHFFSGLSVFNEEGVILSAPEKDGDIVVPPFAFNYPNPFNLRTTIEYNLPLAAHVTLSVYDLIGQEVIQLVEGTTAAGYHQVVWTGRDRTGRTVPTGVYIARMTTPQYSKSIKMVLLK
ncbi:two-component regulator propeller domain-containing protein [Candidatus Neomarinimicrobiota bacterium]